MVRKEVPERAVFKDRLPLRQKAPQMGRDLAVCRRLFMNIDASMLVAQFISGLCRGMILFLMASGLTLVFGVMRVINFAHGSFYMLSAYMAYSITQFFMGNAYGFWIALIVVPLAVGAVGGIVEVFLLRRIYQKNICCKFCSPMRWCSFSTIP